MEEVFSETAERLSDEAVLERFRNSSRQPPGSRLLGFEMLRVDQARLEVEIGFDAGPQFGNPMGQVQGGYVCAMLDECMSVAGVVASNFTCVMPTLEMKTSFLRPAMPGRLRGVGRVVKWGRTIAFTEGELYDEAGKLVARASGTAMPTPRSRFRA